jgi:phytoene desaturase
MLILYVHYNIKVQKLKIAVIGSGIGGLGAAVRLQAKGHDVSVFEANDFPGGKLTDIRSDGFRFDAGPTLFTMPENVTDLFEAAGKKPEDYFEYRRVGESCRYFYPDGTHLTAWEDHNRFAKECRDVFGIEEHVVLDFLKHSKKLYEISGEIFMKKSLHKLSTYLSFDTFKSFLQIHRLELTKTMNKANEQRLGHPKLVQLFNRFATYNGSNPYMAPGILNIIPHLEFNIGTFYPVGGMSAITRSVTRLAGDLGVEFHYNTPVNEIIVKNGTVKGIRTENGELNFDRVVSNMDVVPTYRKLLSKEKAPERTLNQGRSTSAILFYWGIKGKFDQMGLQNIFFSDDYAREFDYMFNKGAMYDDPTVYVHNSSVLEPDDAPEGCMNWHVLINAPHNSGQNWDEMVARTRKNVLRKLSKDLNKEIEPMIITEKTLDPRSIEARTGSYQGSLYGANSNGLFTSFIRHPNFSQKIKGLYFCGGSVHPGGGVPLCLLSGKIVSDLLK